MPDAANDVIHPGHELPGNPSVLKIDWGHVIMAAFLHSYDALLKAFTGKHLKKCFYCMLR